MKFHWGTAIAIFYTCFVIAMVSMVVKSTYHKAHLVEENYYQKDLNYEVFRQKRQNANRMDAPVKIQYEAKTHQIILQFPKDMPDPVGSILMFRPSNQLVDKEYDLAVDQNGTMQILADTSLLSGLWRVKIDWKSQGKNYYKEESIVL